MGATHHVFDYLESPAPTAPLAVIFGNEPFLKRLARRQVCSLVQGEHDTPFATFEGPTTEWRDVNDELSTASLFNPTGVRLAVVQDADDFITKNRDRLEQYVNHPEKNGVLVLEVTKWASNTRLYKLVDKLGLQIECRAPQTGRGKQKSLDQQRMIGWLVQWAEKQHDIRLGKNAAVLLVNVVGPEFGLLDQELAKLALYAPANKRIGEQLVREVGGGWRAKTAWELIDAAVSGDGRGALEQLDRLLQSGEVPAALFGPMSWSLRRFAAATRIYEQAERRGRRMRLPETLERAGFFTWQRDAMQKAEKQLKQLGRERAARLYRWLLETDLALKGSHSSPDMARLALERLILRMDKQLAPRRRR